MKPPPWKKTTTGSDADLVSVSPPVTVTSSVGVKRRNQTLCSALTVTSLVETPLTGVALGEHLRSKKLKRVRLTVPLGRREALVIAEMSERVTRIFKGRLSLGLSVDDIVVMKFRD